MSEVPMDPEGISGEESELEPLEIERLEPGYGKTVGQAEAAVVEAPDGGELLIEGLGPCIGLVGYDKQQKMLFAKHFEFTRPTIDCEVTNFLEKLREQGITITDSAVAGGNLDYEDRERNPTYFEKMTEAKKRLIQSGIAHKSNIDKSEIAESTRGDDLAVYYENGEFGIRFEVGHIEEARS